MKKNSGISLIVLVITIIVIIILAGSVILSLADNNPISQANAAVFKSDISNIQDELRLYLLSNIQMDGSYIYPNKDAIKSANKYNSDTLNFVKDKVIYKTSDINEKNSLEQMGVLVDYTDGLVANYKMNGNALDSSGHNNNGVINGTLNSVADRQGKVSNAYSFNGTNNYIQVPYNVAIASVSQVTCSQWLYRSDWSVISGVMKSISKTEVGGWQLSFNNAAAGIGYVALGVYRTGIGYIYAKSLYTELTSGWHHFVGTYDGRYTKLYIDGELKNTLDSTTNANIGYNHNNSLIIGAEAGSGTVPAGEYFSGSIDDVRIYNRALTAEEITSLYNIYWEN